MASLNGRPRLVQLSLAASILCCSFWASRAAEPRADDSRPRLAVLVVVDQLRGDYLERWAKLFGEGGFRRLQTEGAWFQDCHYPYASTVTAPGHASIVTGCSPDKHGIVMNDWFDRAAGSKVYCTASNRHHRVPPTKTEQGERAGVGNTEPPVGAMSPERLLSPTLGDALKDATGGKARVIALSYKDRSAILLGGKGADACYWFDTGSGTVITSTYYRDRLHGWAEAFNRESRADRWFGKDWDRFRGEIDYAAYSGPDDVNGEGTGIGQGRTFPHAMTGGAKTLGKRYYEAVYSSPFGNELLVGLTLKAIDAEHLGAGETPDLLCVSFSSSDIVGHIWGPDSQEVLDVTLRMDDILRRLLNHLDTKVGKGRYVLALTADHGVCPLPEVSLAGGKEAGRLSPSLLGAKSEEFLRATFDKNGEKGRWVEGSADPWVYLNQRLIQNRGLSAAEVEDALVGWLKKQRGVVTAYGRTQLIRGLDKGDLIGEQVRKSFYPDRCGDVVVVTKPFYLMIPFLTGTTHGTPHPYDTHVPLLVYGPGIQSGIRKDRVAPQAIAAILAHSLGIHAPGDAEVQAPDGLFVARADERRPAKP
jgi:Type I phosphodiesterase / nucleotide pyrophosphatase